MMLSLSIVHVFSIVQVVFVYGHDDVAVVSETGVERESRILIQDNYNTLVSRLEQQRTELDQLKAEVAALKSQQDVKPNRVAFEAHLANALSPGQNQLIEFDDVRFNIGQAYRHGTFIAPYNGTYLISVTMCSAGGHYIVVDLLLNGKMIGQVLAGDTVWDACSSETTVTELSAGDDIIVKHHGTSGDYIYGNSDLRNSFTGVLLY